MDERQLPYIIAEAICELIPDCRRRENILITGVGPGRAFEVHVWLEDGEFWVGTRANGRRESVVFVLADPESIPKAAEAILTWDD